MQADMTQDDIIADFEQVLSDLWKHPRAREIGIWRVITGEDG